MSGHGGRLTRLSSDSRGHTGDDAERVGLGGVARLRVGIGDGRLCGACAACGVLGGHGGS